MACTFYNITKAAFSGALLAAAASCTYDASLCVEDRPGYKDGNDIWLSVDVRSLDNVGARASRAEGDDAAGHPEEAGTDAENFIDVNDVKVMFVGPDGTVMRTLGNDEYTVVKEENGYKLAFRINREYFNTTLSNPTFKLMVVANTKGPNRTSAPDFSLTNTWAKTPEQVAEQHIAFKYEPGENAWVPSDDNGYIPMTGIVTTPYTTAAIDTANTQETAFDAGTIDMQRTMAKFRFIDVIQEKDPSMTGVSISAVRLQGYANKGAYFPANNYGKWYTNGACALENATMPRDWYKDKQTLNSTHVTFSEGSNSYNAFIGYVPEFNRSELLDGDHYPTLEVDIKGLDAPTEPEKIQTFYYSLSSNNIKQIVRNHIYEFRINVETSFKLDLTVDVKEWECNKFEYELSDIVVIDGENRLQWETDGVLFSTGQKEYNDKTESQLTIAAEGSDDKAVKGTFKISAPIGSTWTAYFIPGENGSGAFEFVDVDEDGNIKSGSNKVAITGNVGDPAEFYLHAAHPADAFNHYAELVVAVRSADGRVQYAPIGYNGSTRYVIFRQKTL